MSSLLTYAKKKKHYPVIIYILINFKCRFRINVFLCRANEGILHQRYCGEKILLPLVFCRYVNLCTFSTIFYQMLPLRGLSVLPVLSLYDPLNLKIKPKNLFVLVKKYTHLLIICHYQLKKERICTFK